MINDSLHQSNLKPEQFIQEKNYKLGPDDLTKIGNKCTSSFKKIFVNLFYMGRPQKKESYYHIKGEIFLQKSGLY